MQNTKNSSVSGLFLFTLDETAHFPRFQHPSVLCSQGAGRLTFAEEGADHEAEGDGGDGEADQEDQHQGGVAVREDCHVLLHLHVCRPRCQSAHTGVAGKVETVSVPAIKEQEGLGKGLR